MKVKISSNVKCFELYPRGGEAKSWGIIETLRYAKSQSRAEIFLAPDHAGGVHNSSMTQPLPQCSHE